MKAISQWFPVRERALAIGISNGGALVGAIIAPPLLVWITLKLGWQSAFLLPSFCGFVWILLWRMFYQPPDRHPLLSPAELSYIQDGSGDLENVPPRNKQILGWRQTWALMLCRFFVGPVFQFYIYWLPEYLYRDRGLSLKSIGMFAWMPFLFGDVGSIAGGWASGALIRFGFSVTAARAITMAVGSGCCLSSLAAFRAGSAPSALAWISIVLAGHTFLSANMFAAVSDIFPQNAVGRVTALTGVAGGLSGMLFPVLTGFLVDHFSYLPVFCLASVMPLLGCLLLFVIAGPLKPILALRGRVPGGDL